MTRTHIQLGRVGDVLNILPLLHADYKSTGTRQRLMVAAEYASLLEGCSYVEPIIYQGPHYELSKAVELAKGMGGDVVVSQINGPLEQVASESYARAGQAGAVSTSYQKESWRVVGRLGEWDSCLPLVFDQRNPEREEALLRSNDLIKRGKSKPLIVISLEGNSSPFPHKELLLSMVREKFAKTHRILMLPQAERFYDLLAIYEKASLLIASDSAPLHLAWACRKLPVFALANDKPSMWNGSSWRPNHVWYCRYSDFVARSHEMLSCIATLKDRVEDSALLRVWSEYEDRQIDNEGLAVSIGMCGRDSQQMFGESKRVPFLKDVIRMAMQKAHSDSTNIMLLKTGTNFESRKLTVKPPFFSYRMVAGGFSPIADVFCASKQWWRERLGEIPDLFISTDYYWSECLRALFQKHGAKDATGICFRERANGATPKPTSKTSGHNIKLCSEFVKAHKIYARYPKVSEQAECLPLETDKLFRFGYNPSIIRFNDEMIMAYRYHKDATVANTSLAVASIGPALNVVQNGELISTTGRSLDDPKLFYIGNKIMVNWVDSAWPHDLKSVMTYAALNSMDAFEIPQVPHNDGTTCQKNWVFWNFEGKLYCLFQCHPSHLIYTPDSMKESDWWKICETAAPRWPYGEIRGGTSPVPYEGNLLRFFHSSLRNELGVPMHRYYIGCYLMEPKPPFAVVRVCKKPILYGSEVDDLTPQQRKECKHWKANVVFPSGIVERDGHWILSIGENDSACRLVKITPEMLNL